VPRQSRSLDRWTLPRLDFLSSVVCPPPAEV